MRASDLEPRKHDPPPGWPPEVFARLTDAVATALVAAVRRRREGLQESAAMSAAEPGGELADEIRRLLAEPEPARAGVGK